MIRDLLTPSRFSFGLKFKRYDPDNGKRLPFLSRIRSSLRYRVRYAISTYLSQFLVFIRQGKYGHGPRLTQIEPLIKHGIPVELATFDIREVRRFWNLLCTSSKRLQRSYSAEHFWQKIPQYYFSWQAIREILENPGSVYIDIAGTASSPYQDVLKRLAKASSIYTQDLVFPEGVNGTQIGGSAERIPLPDASVDAMTLHCSFEHFEGDADIGFVREAGRLLRPGGRVCIIPLYLGEYAFTLCDPAWGYNLSPDKDTVIHFFPRWGERHGRFYSAETLLERIIKPAQDAGLIARVIRFTNVLDLDPSCYTHFSLILDKQ